LTLILNDLSGCKKILYGCVKIEMDHLQYLKIFQTKPICKSKILEFTVAAHLPGQTPIPLKTLMTHK